MSNHKRNIPRFQKPRKTKSFFKHKKSVLIICLLLITTYLFQIKPVFSATTRHVPTEYATIQAAVNAASAGDTIQVDPKPYNEPYNEHIYINKTLIIRGDPTNPVTTIIDGTANGPVFDLEASNVEISGFTICNAGDGNNTIVMERDSVTQKADYNKIYNNIITTGQYGVYIAFSHNNIIQNNTFINNPFGGIYLSNANFTQIIQNTIRGSSWSIKTAGARNNIITDNTISQTSYGIFLSLSSTSNIIRRNTIYAKTSSVYSSSDNTTVDHNIIKAESSGIYLSGCKTGSIKYNTVINSSFGIRLYATTGSNNVSNNKILYTDLGAIEAESANGNTFAGNWIQQNKYGMYLPSSSSNIIYRNNFLDNNRSAYSVLSNTWDKNGQGNYWSDYSGTGAYTIRPGGGNDNYPLKTTWSEHDIEVQSVTPSASEANQGAIVDITVTVKNRANKTVSETFTVTTKYNSTIIGTKTVYNLAKGATNSSTFHWNTAEIAPGNYIISAEASVVPDELNTDNNHLTDGTVKIKIPTYDVTINAYCNSEGASVSVSITMDGTPTEYNTPHTFTGLSDTHTFTVPSADANGHQFKQWSTGATTPTISVNSDGTYTAFYEGKLMGDVNGDGTVDYDDLVLLNQAFGSTGGPPPSANWNLDADLNKDNIIDIQDLLLLGQNYGKTA